MQSDQRVKIDARVYDSKPLRRARLLGKIVGYTIVTVCAVGVLTILSMMIAAIVRSAL